MCCASGFLVKKSAQLPTIIVKLNNLRCTALIDSGCSRTIVSSKIVKKFESVSESVVMMDGTETKCCKIGEVNFSIQDVEFSVNCFVLDILPGYDVLIGMDIISYLGGVYICKEGVNFLTDGMSSAVLKQDKVVCAVGGDVCRNLKIVDQDFSVDFDGESWNAKWKWKEGGLEPNLTNKVSNYRIPEDIKDKFDTEIEEWIANGWLKKYHGSVSGIIPLMAVNQVNKGKVRPVLDYRELNQYVSAHTADSDVCGEKLRNWRKMGSNLSIVDLRKAYLQINIDESFWKYQVVKFKGQYYTLTRLGFGLNVAPKIMSAVLKKVLSLEPKISSATDSYIDDIIVNNDIVSGEEVVIFLRKYGLDAKPPEKIENARVLGLRLVKKDDELIWKRDNDYILEEEKEDSSESPTKRKIFSICGKLIGHFPVAGWLRPACSFLKRLTNETNWDECIDGHTFSILKDILSRIKEKDPVTGSWEVNRSDRGTVWVDASNLAIGVVVVIDGKLVEDASWIRQRDDNIHINISELEAVIKGINLALKWNLNKLDLMTDSASVNGWLKSLINRDQPIRVKGIGEALVRRRMQIIIETIISYDLDITITLVKSQDNKADQLTRVPKKWMKQDYCCSADTKLKEGNVIRDSHEEHHLGVNRTLYIAKSQNPNATIDKKQVENVISNCERCKSVDPAPVRWDHGTLDVPHVWKRLACDVTHYRKQLYLSVIDCGPSRFAIWKKISTESAAPYEIEEIFRERGPPAEFLTDNGKIFRSEKMKRVCSKWQVELMFRCANRPSGNGIVERNHRTVKRMAARSKSNILDMVYWYNVSPKDNVEDSSVPMNGVYVYERTFPNLKQDRGKVATKNSAFYVGQRVYVKPKNARCTDEWPIRKVSNVRNDLTVEIDHIPRHVADIRPVGENDSTEDHEDHESEVDQRRPERTRYKPMRYINEAD